ncbi:MAG TPA: TonB-dependent receptor [Pyrinomonadaceae bacterium]|nr:TonB-dependent receptor [Pyrinomonadaceae bacterium]
MRSNSLRANSRGGARRWPLLRGLAAAICCALFASTLALAQTAQGTVQGTIADQNGAVVVGATVEATNQATGEKRTVTASDQGTYTLPNLAPGLYTLAVTAPGFAGTTVKDVNVTVSFTLTQDVTLNPAGAQETVTVSTSDAQTTVNTTDQQLSTLITNEKIIDLPLLSRDPNSLLLLAPGTSASTSALGGIVVNGQRERNNNFLVDGIDNNDTDVPGIPGGIATPNIDATQEFRVITNNFNAEFGRNTGAVINIATKNGTNEFHGNAYIYYRSDRFAARNFFDETGAADPLQRRQFGGSIGGPIKQDRTFFFFNYERDDFDQGIQVVSVVPTARARQGLFDFGGSIGTIDARETGANNALGLPINQNFVDLLNSQFPLPNTGGDGPLPGIFEFFRFSTQTNDLQDQYSARVDHRISEKHNLTGSFNIFDGTFEFCCETFPNANDAIIAPQRTYRLSLNLVSTFSSNFINEFRFGGNRARLTFAGPGDAGVSAARGEAVLTALQRSGVPREGAFGGTNGGLVNFGIGGIGGFGFFDTQFRTTGTTVLGDSVTWVKGEHTFKFGGETRFVYSNGASNFFRQEALNFNFPTTFGFPILLDNEGDELSLGGNAGAVQNFASFLYGIVASQSQSQFFNIDGQRTDADYRGYRQREWDVFFQDTWKVRPNLSLNYGLRYEFKGVPFEVNGQMSNLVAHNPSGATPAGGFRFELVGKNSGGSSNLYEDDHNNFAPRVGFAYSPDFKDGFLGHLFGGPGRTSIRGGYGVFYDRVFGNLFSNSSANPPFQRDFFVFQGDFVENIPNIPTQDPSPLAFDEDFLFPVLFPLPGNNAFQEKFATPYTQTWNFGIQRQFKGDILVEADYVGSKGTNLLTVLDGNLTSVDRVNAITGSDNPVDPFDPTTNFFNGSLNTAFFQSALNLSIGHSTYHAGQFRFTKNFGGRIGVGQIQAAYTLSHSIDNSVDPLVAQAGERSFPRDSSGFAGGLGGERGNSGFDVRHRFVGNMTYALPFRSDNKWVNGIIGNWQMSGIWQWQSGNPFSVFGFTDSAGTALGQRADFLGGNLDARSSGERTQTGPDASLFDTPCPVGDPTCSAVGTSGRQGSSGRNAFYGPDFNNVDFTLAKRFPFGGEGKYRFTIRADFFNLFNRVNFATPVNTIASANFGQSIATFRSRTIQFVGRFDF